MFSEWGFLLVGIIGLLFFRSYDKDTRIDLKIHYFWKSFREKYPEELKDAMVEIRYKYNMSFLYELSNKEAYKKLSKEESKELIQDLNEIKGLLKDLASHERLKDISLYVGIGGIGVFIFSILYYYLN
tara:strand:+ start:401 stop:784 length:384 start_codon:yes stop_codon:yes gene_type:complete